MIYECKFCLFVTKVEREHEAHKQACIYDKRNIDACTRCAHCSVIEKKLVIPRKIVQDKVIDTHGFFCEKTKNEMYPRKAVRLGLVERYPGNFNGEILMPYECDYFEDEIIK